MWKKHPETGEPTFEEYMKRLNGHWAYDSTRGTDPEVTADSEDFADCWNDDPVNNPSHYNEGGVECIEGIESSMGLSQFRGYLKGNVLKYVWRYENKGKPVEDLKKAEWYLSKLITSFNK